MVTTKRLTRWTVCCLMIGALVATSVGQQPQKTDDRDVVRITTNLVQIDAVVTDRSGRVVTSLGAADFTLTVNGKKQEIINFAFNGRASTRRSEASPNRNVPTPPGLQPRQVANTYALVVDDYCMDFEYFVSARKLVQKFVDEHLQPNDAAAIISTRAGTGTLQQFTTDKRLLNAAIRNLRWQRCRTYENPSTSGGDTSRDAQITAANSTRETEALNRNRYGVTAIGTLEYVAQGLQDLPGRKAVIMLSQGLPLISPVSGELDGDVVPRIRRVIEKANRASTVIYTMHLRGLDPLWFSVADGAAAASPSALSADRGLLASRRKEFNLGQDGLIYLADRTGGFSIRNTNDFSGGLSRVVEDQQGYYLLGYRPDEETFASKNGRTRFNSIKITLNKHNDYRVRTRSGFDGKPTTNADPTAATPADQLLKALRSPVGAGGIGLRMTSLFIRQPSGDLQVRSLVHLAANDLSFKTESAEWKTDTIDLAIVTLGADGSVVDQLSKTQTLRIRQDRVDEFAREGLVFVLDVPVKRPGPYELRIAVRDHNSSRLGSARQFVEVPDLTKEQLVLSGLVVNGAQGNQKDDVGIPGNASLASQSGPAVRRFKRGMRIDYGFEVYGANGSSQLVAEMRVYRDAEKAFEGKPQPLPAAEGAKTAISAGGSFELGNALPLGWYTLEVRVVDLQKKKSEHFQWIDFEIVE